MQNYAKIFKWVAWGLMIVSVLLLIWGFSRDFAGNSVDVLLRWAYFMIIVALCAVVVVGIYVSATTNPQSLKRMGFIILGAAVLCLIAYLFAPGKMPLGYTSSVIPTASQLKLTDTMLNLTYILGVAAILAIIGGEIWVAVRNKKA